MHDEPGNEGLRNILIGLGLITLLGLVLRLIQYQETLLGDEISTLWVVRDQSLGHVLSTVSSDAEITPPLYFVLAWLATKLGSAPELVRLPAMVCGTLSIPLVFELGRRAISARVGLVAATIVALSPFLTYFSADGRAYTVLIFALMASTVCMLRGAETNRAGWWVGYGAFTAAAMYTHYTAAFVLAVQLAWLLVTRPEARKGGLIATAVAAVLFVPWLPSFVADNSSPTVKILEAIQGDGFAAKRLGFEQWLFGHPLIKPGQLPGRIAVILVLAGLALALLRLVWLGCRRFRGSGARVLPEPATAGGYGLILLIALACPVGEGLLSLIGPDLLGARNMTASWSGLPVLLGVIVTSGGLLSAIAATGLVLGGFGIGAWKLTRPENGTIDFKAAARIIDRDASPGARVVDTLSAHVSPVPITPLDAYLSPGRPEYALNLPASPPPFLPYSVQVPDPESQLRQAFSGADDVFLAVPYDPVPSDRPEPAFENERVVLPKGWRIVSSEALPGVRELRVVRVRRDAVQPGSGNPESAGSSSAPG